MRAPAGRAWAGRSSPSFSRASRRAGATTVRLEVDVRNASAMAFYRSFGFRKVGRIPDYYGEGRDAFEMERAGPTPGTRGSAS